MKFYKITNEEECHCNLKYYDGLVEDIIPFNNNPKASCCSGGIYFSREDILAFIEYGPWIREVTIPDDALVIQDPDERFGIKWRANKVVLGPRRKITIEIIKELINEGANIHVNNDYILYYAVENGYYNTVKLLLDNGANVHANGDWSLCYAGYCNYYKIVKLLLDYGSDIHVDSDWCRKNWNPYFYSKVMKYIESKKS